MYPLFYADHRLREKFGEMSEVVDRFDLSRKGAVKMIAIGQLLSTLNIRVIASMVEAETTVPYLLLVENDEFLRFISKADKIKEVVDWVNENY